MTSSHTSISHAPNCYRHATVVSAQTDRGFAAENSRRRRVTTPPLPRSLKAQIRVTKGGISAQRLQRTAVRGSAPQTGVHRPSHWILGIAFKSKTNLLKNSLFACIQDHWYIMM